MVFPKFSLVIFIIGVFIVMGSAQKIGVDPMLQNQYDSCLVKKSVEPLEAYFEGLPESQKSDLTFQKDYYALKIQSYERFLKDKLRKIPKNELPSHPDLIKYAEAVKKYNELCPTCGLCASVSKYKTYKSLRLENQFPKEEKAKLLANGYKAIKTGIGIQPRYTFSRHHYIGAEFFVNSAHEPAYSIKKPTSKTDSSGVLCRQDYEWIAATASFGINYSPGSKHLQVLVSPVSLIIPLNIKPLQLGVEFTGDKNILFYRPEVGFGVRGFHLSAGYNAVFRKNTRSDMSRWAYTLGFTHVFDHQ